ncbi:MAG TPA: response regulator transcription factor, partial [Solirubrobacteraceae bacterium]|nr:response regulator transcription factor [Solirubrobacteraceae bacterium]
DPGAEPGVIRVLLADDHALMRRTLRLLLDEEQDIEVVAEADDLASVVQHVVADRPRAVVLDLSITDGSTSEAIRRLRARAPQTQIVIVTMEENPVFAQRALDAGAIGFVSKDLADLELPEAIRRAAHEEQYVSPRISLPLENTIRAVTEDKLTVREVEVLRLIALGYTSVEVAQKLELSPRTVETHRARILRKLGLTTRAELVAYALRRGLLRT